MILYERERIHAWNHEIEYTKYSDFWHQPFLLYCTVVSTQELSHKEKPALYARDLDSLARPRPNGAEPFLDEMETLLLDPELFERFCVIEGHSALQMGSRRFVNIHTHILYRYN